ncbi:MAG: SemiSWEET transporter [Alphaproteobacteria bacterium]|nr:SemiSWEET transporter [Alphaproteobacteria bacterium]
MHLIGEFLGYLAGICIAVAFLPQTLKTIKDKDVRGLSLISYVIYCTGIISWVLYGFYLGSVQMIVFNAISLIFAGIVLYMIIQHKK